jgi:hypothetical protein
MDKGQTKTMSAVESVSNIAIGMTIAYITQVIVFPIFGIHVPPSSHIGIVLIFTAVSFVRSFCFRRVFNWIDNKPDKRLTRMNEVIVMPIGMGTYGGKFIHGDYWLTVEPGGNITKVEPAAINPTRVFVGEAV